MGGSRCRGTQAHAHTRAAVSSGFDTTTHWRHRGKTWPAHRGACIPEDLHKTMMRFRLGCCDLEVNRPRGRAREARPCRACGVPGAVEDEYGNTFQL